MIIILTTELCMRVMHWSAEGSKGRRTDIGSIGSISGEERGLLSRTAAGNHEWTRCLNYNKHIIPKEITDNEKNKHQKHIRPKTPLNLTNWM